MFLEILLVIFRPNSWIFIWWVIFYIRYLLLLTVTAL